MPKISIITSLYKCSKYLNGYFAAVEKIINKEDCEFLLLHNAPVKEELLVIKNAIMNKHWFRHIIIEEREGLYATWNRGVRLASSDYCAIWNVDDVRFPDSLQLQANILDNYPEGGLVTGDINGTNKYGEIGSKIYKHNRFESEPKEALRSCLVGCFPMWRKSIHSEIGYFDEQFNCVADFDFQIRVAIKYTLYSVPKSLGIYLENDRNKISSNGLQIYENNIVYLRYGIYEKLVLNLVPQSIKRYSVNSIINFNNILPLEIKKPFSIKYRFAGIIISMLKLPKYIAKEFLFVLFNKRR